MLLFGTYARGDVWNSIFLRFSDCACYEERFPKFWSRSDKYPRLKTRFIREKYLRLSNVLEISGTAFFNLTMKLVRKQHLAMAFRLHSLFVLSFQKPTLQHPPCLSWPFKLALLWNFRKRFLREECETLTEGRPYHMQTLAQNHICSWLKALS